MDFGNFTNQTLSSLNNISFPVEEPNLAWIYNFHIALHYVLLGILITGFLLNCLVFIMVIRILRHQISLTPAWALMAMCIADITCLLCLAAFSLVSGKIFNMDDRFQILKTTYCKLILFLTHSTSAFGVWCWVVLSFLRYLAAFQPLLYKSHVERVRGPIPILVGTGVMCAGLELWIMVMVKYNPMWDSCSEDPDISPSTVRGLHLFEISWTYYLPVCFLTFMDLRVLCKSPRGPFHQPCGIASRRQRRRQLQVLKHYLFVTSLDLLLNLPSCTLRFVDSIHIRAKGNLFLDHILPGICYVLYYSQFCSNFLYLMVLQKRNEPETNSPTRSRLSSIISRFAVVTARRRSRGDTFSRGTVSNSPLATSAHNSLVRTETLVGTNSNASSSSFIHRIAKRRWGSLAQAASNVNSNNTNSVFSSSTESGKMERRNRGETFSSSSKLSTIVRRMQFKKHRTATVV